MKAFLGGALVASVCHGAPIPLLPDNFSSEIQANFGGDKGYSMNLREYYDYIDNRLRLERHANDHSQIDICDLDKGIRYSVRGELGQPFQCNVTKDFTNCAGPGISTRGNHIPRAAEFLEQTRTLVYAQTEDGTAKPRGITCDAWRAETSMPSFRNPLVTLNYTVDWYFAVPEWVTGRPGRDGTTPAPTQRLPVRVHVYGGEYTSGVLTKPFEHSYEFIDFSEDYRALDYGRDQSTGVFEPLPEWNCGQEKDNMSPAVKFGRPTPFFLLGGLVAVCSLF